MNSFKLTVRLPPLPSSGDIIKIYGLKAAKHLSQNFLLDCKLQSKVVSCSGKLKGCHVIEVGPGPGCLTRCMYEQGASYVNVIEKDKRFIPSLQLIKDATNNRMGIHLGDVLKTDLSPLFPKELAQPWNGQIPDLRIIGNLPFNISTPLIIKWIHEISKKSSAWVHGRVPLTLTFQEEVAQRMIANPYDCQRSKLSIMCQNWCKVDYKFLIKGKSFVPKPDVNVVVVKFTPREEPLIDLDFKLVEKIVNSIFSGRQKHCKKSIGYLYAKPIRENLVTKLLDIADVDPTTKSCNLSLQDINRICHAYIAISKNHDTVHTENELCI